MLISHVRPVRVVRRRSDLPGFRGADLKELRIAVSSSRDLRHIIRSDHLIIAVQPRRIREMALRTSQFRDLCIHHIHKIRHTACHMFCQSIGRLIYGSQKQRVETVLNGHRIACNEAQFISAVRLYGIHRLVRISNGIGKIRMFQNNERCEDLCDTRRIIFHMAVLSEKHRSGIHIHDSPRLRRDSCVRRPVRPCKSLYRSQLGKYQYSAEYLCQFLF